MADDPKLEHPASLKTEQTAQFESRKKDHIRIALSQEAQSSHLSGLDRIQLIHEALPDLNFQDLDISQDSLGLRLATPFLISSMTAGHEAGTELNLRLARAASRHGWVMGVGSQRRELFDPAAREEWRRLRKAAPGAVMLGNIGIAQIIETKTDDLKALTEALEARALIVHLNPLQECIQPEGNLNFKGSSQALARVTKELGIPVVVKETGCGIAQKTLKRLLEMGVAAVDVAGTGGTHWGRVEGYRNAPGDMRFETAQTFKDWGLSTVESLLQARELPLPFPIWASGGVRHGLDAAKLLALGAERIGFAKAALEPALQGEETLDLWMERTAFELKVALFCTGSGSLKDLRQTGVWKWT